MANMKIKTLKSVWILFLFYGLSITSGSCPPDKPIVFLAEPRDVTVKEGSNVSFSCTINMTENSSFELSISWDVNPGGLRKLVVRKDMTSKLTVYNITREEHYVCCKVNFEFSNHRETCRYSSRRAKVTVRHFPRRDELTCSTLNRSLSVQAGDSLHIQCQVTQANPSIDIGWRIDGHSFRQKPATFNGLLKTSIQKVNISRSMQGQYFICVVTNGPAFPGEEITCSIGPLDVQNESRSVKPGESTADITTLNPTIETTTGEFLNNTSTSLPNTFETQTRIPHVTTVTSLKTVSRPTRTTPETMESRWKRWEILVVVCAISGALLAILLTTLTCIPGINWCKSTERRHTVQGNHGDLQETQVQTPLTGTILNDFKFPVDRSQNVEEQEHERQKITGREDSNQDIPNKSSLQKQCTTRTSLRYSDAWSSISSLSDSSAGLEDTANVSLTKERELPGHVSLGNKFLVDIADVYVIQKLNNRRASVGLLLLNPAESACTSSVPRHVTLPREMTRTSLSIQDATQTSAFKEDTMPLSRQHPSLATLLQGHQQSSTCSIQCETNQSNSDKYMSKCSEEMHLHEETKL